MDPALLEEFCAEYTAHLNRLRARRTPLWPLQGRTRQAGEGRDRLIQAIKDGVPAYEVRDDLARIAARREELQALIEGATESRCCCIRTWRHITAIRSPI
jgi:site-specific DNA recombinase